MRGEVVLRWSLDDAVEVAEVFLSASTRNGHVVDQGFYDDYRQIMDQIALAEMEDEQVSRVRVVVVDGDPS